MPPINADIGVNLVKVYPNDFPGGIISVIRVYNQSKFNEIDLVKVYVPGLQGAQGPVGPSSDSGTGSFALKTDISGAFQGITGSMLSTYALIVNVSGAFSLDTSSFALKTNISGAFDSASYLRLSQTSSMLQPYLLSSDTGSITINTSSFVVNSQTSSFAIKTAISGAFTITSSSLGSRIAVFEGHTVISSSNQIATEISGAFLGITSSMLSPYLLSSSTSSFVTNSQTSSFVVNSQTASFVQNSATASMLAAYVPNSLSSSFALNTNITGAFTILSSSATTRITTLENTTLLSSVTSSLVTNSQTSSFALKTNVTGAFSVASASLGDRIKVFEIVNILSSSAQIASEISGAVVNQISGYATTGSNVFKTNQIISGSTTITGSLIVTGSVDITGSSFTWNGLPVMTGNTTGSFVTNSQTSSMLSPYALIANVTGAFNSVSSSLGNRIKVFEIATVLSSSAQIASEISGSVNSITGSFVTNAVTSSMLLPYALIANISGAFNGVTSSFVTNSQTSSFITNSQTSSFVVNSQISGFATTGSNTFSGSQIITGSMRITGSLLNSNSVLSGSFSGSFEGDGRNLIVSWSMITGIPASISSASIDTSSFAIKTSITGAFTEASSGFSTRITYFEGKNLLSGSNQIATEISGAVTSQISGFATTGSNTFKSNQIISGSVTITGSLSETGSVNITGSEFRWNNYTVVTSNDTSSFALKTNVSGAFVTDSASLASRATVLENTKLDSSITSSYVPNSLSSSFALKTDISGAFTVLSSSLQSRITTAENTKLDSSATASILFLSQTGGFATSGSNTFKANQIISGSLDVTGSSFQWNYNNVLTSNLTSSFALSTNITGAFTTTSSSLASRTTVLENTTLLSSVTASYVPNSLTGSFALSANITGSFTSLSSSFASRITTDETVQASILAATSSYALKTDITGSSTVLSSSATSRITTLENATSTYVVTTQITGYATTGSNIFIGNETIFGSLIVTGSVKVTGSVDITGSSFKWNGNNVVTSGDTSSFALSTNISGSITTFSSSITSRTTTLENTTLLSSITSSYVPNSLSSSFALKVNITGAFSTDSSSFGTRITSLENLTTGSYALKTDVTGAFTVVSSSLASRITVTENTKLDSSFTSSLVLNSSTSSFALKTDISGAFTTTSSSLASRTTVLENTKLDSSYTASVVKYSDTASMLLPYALIANVSGSNTAFSASVATRITTIESIETDLMAATSSYALKTNVSGAFTALSQSFTNNYLSKEGGIITGNVTVMGTASIALLYTLYATSSVIYQSGSTKFGDTMDDNHSYTGSLAITGSGFVWNGWTVVTSNDTSSYALKTNISGAFLADSSSLASRTTILENTRLLSSITSSLAYKTDITGAFAIDSASFGTRVTTLENAGYALSTAITGFATTGSNTFKSNQIISGSVDITGSSFQYNYNNVLTSNQTSSFALSANISGSITVFSSSITSRVTTVENAQTTILAATASYALKTDITGSSTVLSSSIAGRVTTIENAGYVLSTSITGFATTGSNVFKAGQTISGSVDITGSSFQWNYNNVLTSNQTGSFALSTNISGAFTSLSSSIASRITTDESTIADILTATASFALKAAITGSNTVLSSSLAGRVTTLEGAGYALATNVSGAFTSLSSSFASRITTDESVLTDILAASSSFALKTSVSGAFTVASGGLASRITIVENTQTDILTATSSYALKVNISGSITAFSSSESSRVTTLENAGYITSAQSGGFATTGSNTFTGTQTVTNMTLATNGQILLTVPTVNSQSTGPTINAFNVGYATSSIGDLVYLDVNSAWQKTDANTTALYNGLLGVSLAVATSASALLVALPGSIIFCNAFPTFTIGSPIYMSETAGVVTQTQPTTTDAAIRVIGWGIHANKMYFNPSQDYITHT